MSFEGRIALVTGAGGQGIGRSIALTLAREGAGVIVNYRRREDDARRTAAAIDVMGRPALVVQTDVTDAAQVDAMMRTSVEAFGRVDIVVNNAGGPWTPQDVTAIGAEHLRRVLAGEIESTFNLLRSFLPGMRERGYGRFVNIGGHMADNWRFGPPDAPVDYPMAKAARHWLTRTLAPMEAPRGITINAVAPGPTRRFSFEEAVAALQGVPEGAENTPQHIAEAVAFLCSDAAARVTGAVIPLPGDRPV